MIKASTVMSTGRNENGRSALRLKLAEGKRDVRIVQRLRRALLEAVSAADLRGVVRRLVAEAKKGDVSAAKLLFDRLLGPALALDVEERIAALEERLSHEA